MKLLESLRIRASSRLRREKAQFGIGDRPARLDIRLDDFDAPAPVSGTPLRVDQWQERIVEVLQWVGPLPVRITASAAHAFLPDIVRFCHRLEMPVTVRTGSAGLDVARAEELVDRGMARCELVVSELGGGEEAAVRALIHARHSRAAPLDVHLHLALAEGNAAHVKHVFPKARALGVDSVVLCAPWQGAAWSAGAGAGIGEALGEGWPLQGTSSVAREALERMDGGGPGGLRSGGHCALGGLRLALAPDGMANICPFKPGSTAGPLAESGRALSDHRKAIRSCGRVCGHPELV